MVFGATVSGRPPELPGVEAMVGLFINTLPVRVRVAGPARAASTGCAALQAAAGRAARSTSTARSVEVQGWSEVPRGQPLFESLVVFENYPVERPWHGQVADRRRAGRSSVAARAVERTNYPLDADRRARRRARRSSSPTTRAASTPRRGRADARRTPRRCSRRSPPTRDRRAGRPAAADRRPSASSCWSSWNATAADVPARRLRATSCSRPRRARTPDAVAVVCDGAAADLPRAGRARQPAGPPPARARGRAGGAGRRCAPSARSS